MGAIWRREMRSYFTGVFGWVLMAAFLLFSGIFISVYNLLLGLSAFSQPLSLMRPVLIVLIPLLSMRSIAEERHSKTDRLLYSLPIRLSDVVLGKFFAMLTVFLIPTAVTALCPILLSMFGTVNFASAYLALLGYVLMGAALIAICTFLSSLTENQLLAGLVSVGVCLLLYFFNLLTLILPVSPLFSFLFCVAAALLASLWAWRSSESLNLGLGCAALLILPCALVYAVKSSLYESLVPSFFRSVDVFSRYSGFTYGHFDLSGTLFYLTVTAIFLFFTVVRMEKRRRV